MSERDFITYLGLNADERNVLFDSKSVPVVSRSGGGGFGGADFSSSITTESFDEYITGVRFAQNGDGIKRIAAVKFTKVRDIKNPSGGRWVGAGDNGNWDAGGENQKWEARPGYALCRIKVVANDVIRSISFEEAEVMNTVNLLALYNLKVSNGVTPIINHTSSIDDASALATTNQITSQIVHTSNFNTGWGGQTIVYGDAPFFIRKIDMTFTKRGGGNNGIKSFIPTQSSNIWAFYMLCVDSIKVCRGEYASASREAIVADILNIKAGSQDCQAIYAEYCSKGENIESNACKDYCNQPGVYCDNTISNYCKSLPLEDAKNKDICGCFMPAGFYDNYFNDLLSKFEFTGMAIPKIPACFYSNCSSAPIKPRDIRESRAGGGQVCPDISQCIQVTTLKTGNITGNVSVPNTANCNFVTTKTVNNTTPTSPSDNTESPSNNPIAIEASDELTNNNSTSLVLLFIAIIVIAFIYYMYSRRQVAAPVPSMPISQMPVSSAPYSINSR